MRPGGILSWGNLQSKRADDPAHRSVLNRRDIFLEQHFPQAERVVPSELPSALGLTLENNTAGSVMTLKDSELKVEEGEMDMLSVSIQRIGTSALVSLVGSIVIGETAPLVNALKSLDDVDTIVLDLAQVSKIDAAGLSELLRIREKARLGGIALKLRNVMKRVSEVLEITKLNSVFDVASEPEVTLVHRLLASTSPSRIPACL